MARRKARNKAASTAAAPPPAAPKNTVSGRPVKEVVTPADLAQAGFDPAGDVGLPGTFPFTRGVHPTMYRGRLWTMRQYAGFGTAEESNKRYHFLLKQGSTGLSVAFDLPTQIGLDSDDPRAKGEVGRVGVAIDSLRDMEALFDGIPLDKVSTSMTINAPAAILLALYLVVAEEQGVPWTKVRGTVQNDVLKEYIARGTYIYPPGPSLRLAADVIEFCAKAVPKFNAISISGYHVREAGATAAQELAFTLGNGRAYVRAVVDRGLDVDAFAANVSFFFNAHNDLFEEIAKFRAARRMWARIMKDEFGARDPRALLLRFHTQTAGSSLQAQQPENNVVRTSLQALAAVLGGTQSLHTNALDEALGLPTEKAARIALRTQQILAHETGVANTVDPFGGSYHLERLTMDLERDAQALLRRMDDLGGTLAAIEQGFQQHEIQEAAYRDQQDVEARRRIVVGVNAFASGEAHGVDVLKVDPALERRQVARLRKLRRERDAAAAASALAALKAAARGGGNVMEPILDCVRALATVGEIADAMRDVFGEHRPTTDF